MSPRDPRVLFVCPDYVSHFYPMSAVAEECRRRGMAVSFATGPGLRDRIDALGFDHEELVLGPGSNTGVMRSQQQAGAEAEHMRAFFDATRQGPIETLLYQSRAREHDMLWRPDEVHARLAEILTSIRVDYIVVDQLAFGATLALHALQVPFASFLPANPSSLPGESELFGFPEHLPSALQPTDEARLALRQVCADTDARFTHRFNQVLARLAPAVSPVPSAFRFTSRRLVLLNFPAALGDYRRNQIPAQAHFIGSCVRSDSSEPAFEAAVASLDPDRPTVYVSFGTFLSAREDVLRSVALAVRQIGAQCIMATGSAGTNVTDVLPDDWITAPVLPQIAALRHSDLVISHGGNNTVTEALTLGVPLLVAPFSSDQFDSVCDLERAGLGASFDPNAIDGTVLATQISELLHDRALQRRTAELAARLQAHPGSALANDLLERTFGPEIDTPSELTSRDCSGPIGHVRAT